MIRAGLTGGLASGKSFVGRILEQLGCHVVRADELGHQVLQADGEAYEGVVREFGPGILDESAHIDRKQLASLVFNNPDRLETLNKLVHPAVIRREEEFLAEAAAKDPLGVGVVEAAILVETGSFRRFDKLILAVCSRDQQIERAMRRDQSSREDAEARLNRQMPLEEKRQHADYIIDTSGTKEHTAEQAFQVYEDLKRLAALGVRPEGTASRLL